MPTKPLVVAIASVSGGGKTTITKQLQTALPHAEALYFDDYDYDAASGIDDVCMWVENGADYDLWNLQRLVDQITTLLANNDRSLDFILLDYSFAYQQKQLRPFLDYAIFVDTPLDLALARRLLRDFSLEQVDAIRENLRGYLLRGRSAYLHMLTTIKPDSDFIVDGSLPIESIVEIIVKKLTDIKAHRVSRE